MPSLYSKGVAKNQARFIMVGLLLGFNTFYGMQHLCGWLSDYVHSLELPTWPEVDMMELDDCEGVEPIELGISSTGLLFDLKPWKSWYLVERKPNHYLDGFKKPAQNSPSITWNMLDDSTIWCEI